MKLKRLLQHLLLCIIFAFAVPHHISAQGSWAVKSAMPSAATARDGAVSFTVGNIAYTGTGHYSYTYFDSTLSMNVTNEESLVDFWAYDGTAWTQIADISSGTVTVAGVATTPAHAREQAFAFSVATKGYVGGGHWFDNVNYIHYELKDLWEYNPATNVWKRAADIPLTGTATGKAEAVGFSLGAKGYAGMGYYHDNAIPQTLVETRDFWEYNPTNNTWVQKANFMGSYRYGAVGMGINNKGYVGLGISGSTFYNDWYQFDPTNGTWSTRTAFPGPARKGAIGVSLCNYGLVATGITSSGITNTAYEYNQVANTWSTATNFIGGACQEASGFALFGKAYLTTGSFSTSLSKGLWQFTSSVACNCGLASPAGVNQSICGVATAQIGSASATGYTYSWSPSTGLSSNIVSNPTASPTTTTNYIMWVTGTTGAGCYQNDTVTVTVGTPPVANAGVDRNICLGSSAVLGTTAVAGISYTWSPTTALSSSTVSNPTVTPTVAGVTTYVLTATNNTTGCLKRDTVVVKADPIPTPNAGADQNVCLGNSVQIGSTSVAGFTYSWTPSTTLSSATASNPTATPTTTTSYILTVTGVNGGCSRKDTVKLTTFAKPTASAGTDKTLCAGSCTTLGMTAVAGINYSWTPSTGLSSSTVSNPSACPTTTTNYILTATNPTSGCFRKDTVKVTVNPMPVANAGTDKTTCSGIGVAIGSTAVAGVTYAWSPTTALSLSTASNPTASPTATTTYIVTASIGTCSKKDTVLVTVNPRPTASAGTDKVICSGNCIAIGMTAVAGINYSWSPSTGLSSSTVSNPSACPTSTTTNYILTATNPTTGCFRRDTVIVTVNPKPTANAGTDKAVCKGSSVTLGTTAVAGINYLWTPSTTLSSATISNPVATPTATTTYIVTATNPTTGCFRKDTTIVTVNALPTATAGTDKLICAGSTVTLGTTGVAANTYTWSPTTSLSSPYVSNPVSSTTSTRTYILTVKVTATGCTKKDTVIVTVNPAPTATAGSDRTLCTGNCSTLGAAAVAGITYTWTPTTALSSSTVSNPSLCPTVAGTTNYILTARNSTTQCTRRDTVVVTVNASPAATAGVDKTVCSGSSTSIGATAVAGVTYSWTPSTGLSSVTLSNPTASPTATTIYYLTATSSNGCIKKDTMKVTVSAYPAANAGTDKTITAGNSVVIGTAGTSGLLYSWTPSTALSPSAAVAQPVASPLVTTTYILTVTNAVSGCAKKDTMKVTVTSSPISRYANEGEIISDLGQLFKIYPNPTQDMLNIASDIELEGDWSIEISNIMGQVVMSEKVNLNQQVLDFELPVQQLSKGVYMINIYSDKGNFSAKMVKE